MLCDKNMPETQKVLNMRENALEYISNMFEYV